VKLPEGIEIDTLKLKAKLEDGVLKVMLPRLKHGQGVRHHEISIQSYVGSSAGGPDTSPLNQDKASMIQEQKSGQDHPLAKPEGANQEIRIEQRDDKLSGGANSAGEASSTVDACAAEQ